VTPQTALAELASVAAACASEASGATDDDLLALQRSLAGAMRSLEGAAAVVAAEVAHRSRRELGHAGLAQKLGARTPEALVQTVTGSSSATARRLVRVGTLVVTQSSTEPWLRPASDAVASGRLGPEALDAIRSGLGAPTAGVDEHALAGAVRWLLERAASTPVDALVLLARECRDNLDAQGVAAREHELRERRTSRLTRLPDGMTRLVALLDPESAARVVPLLEAATSPRRGGPRFVSDEDVARAQSIVDDERTTEQIALDALVELIAIGARGDSRHVIGTPQPPVRVLVTKRDLDAGVGVGRLEGQSAPVSIATVERHICSAGAQGVLFEEKGAVLDLGRAKRLHKGRQRTAIAARDGGCLMPGCDRPPSWSEVHHIVPWSEGGGTSVDDGVLLCRHHHLLLHNNGWRIARERGEYWLHAPAELGRAPERLQTKSPAMRRLLAG